MAANPTSCLQWVHQTYQSQWKGTVDIHTVPAEDHAPKNPHWCTTMTALGAVVQDKLGKNVTLETILVEADGRSKKEAEQKAAEQVYTTLVEQGWFDPTAPPPPKKSQGVSRATKFLTDNVPANVANPLAYLDVSIGGKPVGRMVLELFRYKKGSTLDLHAPLAVDNFLALCRGVEVAGCRLSYVGVPFTRIMKRFLLQAGDVANKDGTGGAHIHTSYGDHFPDEGLDDKYYRYSHPFMLSSANLGLEDTNSSQFFITLSPAHELAGHHTCFGKVLAGYGVVKEIEALCELTANDAPPCPVIISGAGELPPGTPLHDLPAVAGGGWPLWPEDQGPPPPGCREVPFRLDVARQLRGAGNAAYKQGDAAAALARYQQASRYLTWTSFKQRTPCGDVDITQEEQRGLQDAVLVLLGNTAAAQIKLRRFRAAADTCQELLHLSPDSVKGLLRAGQAHMGLGPAEYSAAGSLLQQALDKAQQQQLPTRDIVEELHRLRQLQQQHMLHQKSRFSAAFSAGLLHHPADDEPPAAPHPPPAPDSDPVAAAAAAAGLRHVVRPPGLRPGPVSAERVLDSSQPVIVDDAWGTHLLMADEDEDEGAAGGGSSSYSRGLASRLARMGLRGEYVAGQYQGPGIDEGGYGSSDQSDVYDEGAGEGQGNGHCLTAHQQDSAPAGPDDDAGRPDSSSSSNGWVAAAGTGSPAAEEAAGGGDGAAEAAGVQQQSGVQQGSSGAGVGVPEEPGVPEADEASEAAAAGVAVSSGEGGGQRTYGDGALGAIHQRVSW